MGWCGVRLRAGRAMILMLMLSPGYDRRPAVAPGGGSTVPLWVPFLVAGPVAASQPGGGIAWMRRQAVMIASAHGQPAAILRMRRLPPRTRRAAAWKSR